MGALKQGREELPHVRGQGQKPGGPHARRAATKRSYPKSQVRGSRREYQTVTVQERPRGAPHVWGQGEQPRGDTQRLRSGAATRGVKLRRRSGVVAGRRYPTPLSPSPGAGWKELQRPNARGQGWRQGGATPCPRPGSVARRTNPIPWLQGHRRA